MKVAYRDSITYKVEKRISKLSNNVILRKDLDDIADYRQISRAIKSLINKKSIIRISNGIYAKAKKSKFANVAIPNKSVDETFKETLIRLRVQFSDIKDNEQYKAKSTTQVVSKNVIRLKSRLRRKLSCGKIRLSYEKNINAK